jgi:hypothetical protein
MSNKKHDAVLIARNKLEEAEEAYLRANGWTYSSANPACLWMWQKTLPDGRTVMTLRAQAVTFQEMSRV